MTPQDNRLKADLKLFARLCHELDAAEPFIAGETIPRPVESILCVFLSSVPEAERLFDSSDTLRQKVLGPFLDAKRTLSGLDGQGPIRKCQLVSRMLDPACQDHDRLHSLLREWRGNRDPQSPVGSSPMKDADHSGVLPRLRQWVKRLVDLLRTPIRPHSVPDLQRDESGSTAATTSAPTDLTTTPRQAPTERADAAVVSTDRAANPGNQVSDAAVRPFRGSTERAASSPDSPAAEGHREPLAEQAPKVDSKRSPSLPATEVPALHPPASGMSAAAASTEPEPAVDSPRVISPDGTSSTAVDADPPRSTAAETTSAHPPAHDLSGSATAASAPPRPTSPSQPVDPGSSTGTTTPTTTKPVSNRTDASPPSARPTATVAAEPLETTVRRICLDEAALEKLKLRLRDAAAILSHVMSDESFDRIQWWNPGQQQRSLPDDRGGSDSASSEPASRSAAIAGEGVSAATDTWLVGDLHGDLLAMQAVLMHVEEESHRAGRDWRIVFLGDLIDDGPYSAEVIECMLQLASRRPNTVGFVVGNHDEAMHEIEEGRRFSSTVSPASFIDELNASEEGSPKRRVARRFIKLVTDAPRCMVLSDGLLLVHGGVPQADLHEAISQDPNILFTDPSCRQDLTWTRLAEHAKKKLTNRHSKTAEVGHDNVVAFLKAASRLGLKRIVRGHDHMPERWHVYKSSKWTAVPVLTINALSTRQREMFPPDIRTPCVARCIAGSLPEVHQLVIAEQFVRNHYGGPIGEATGGAA